MNLLQKDFNLREVKTVHADRHNLHAEIWQLLLSADPSKARVRSYLSEDYTRVGVHNEHYVAVYVLNQLAPTRFELKNMAVVEAYQGIGLGRRMLGHAIGLAEARGAREIVLSIGNSGLSSLEFFQCMGFGIVENAVGCSDRLDLQLTLEPE